MATATYTPIASITLGSSASSVTFSSIPQDYRDLVVVQSASNSSGSTAYARIEEINGDTGSNYNSVWMETTLGGGSGTGTSSNSTAFSISPTTIVNGTENTTIWQMLDYSATDKHKSILCRHNALGSGGIFDKTGGIAFRWADTSAITSFDVRTVNLDVGTTISLFGIEA